MAIATSTLIAALGLAVGAVSAGVQVYSAGQTADAQAKMREEQKKQEALRQQQMNLEAMRKKREIVRQMQVAQAASTSTATNQGGAESSGFAGALATIGNSAGRSGLATGQNQELGNEMFASNSRMAGFMGDAQIAGTWGATAGGVGSLGMAVLKNAGTISQVGQYYGAPATVG